MQIPIRFKRYEVYSIQILVVDLVSVPTPIKKKKTPVHNVIMLLAFSLRRLNMHRGIYFNGTEARKVSIFYLLQNIFSTSEHYNSGYIG